MASKKLDDGMDAYWKHRGDETYGASVDVNNKGEKVDNESAAGVVANQAQGSNQTLQ